MPEYQLFLRPAADGPTETMQFKSEDAGRALELVHRHGFDGSAEIWRDGKRLCNLEYSSQHGYWTIVPAALAGHTPEPSS